MVSIAKCRKLLGIVRRKKFVSALTQWNVAAGVEHMPLLESLRGCVTVVDLGANRGQFALVARYVLPEARVIAFEPLERPADKCRLVFRDDPMVYVHQSAIGPVSCKAEIHVSGRDDSSSLLPITSRQNELFPGTAEAGLESISVFRLGDLLGGSDLLAPALLKIDVQGFELSALEGCEDLLGYFRWIYVECSFVELYAGQALASEVIDWLRKRGFGLMGVHNVAYDKSGRSIQADFLFSADLQTLSDDAA